MTAEQLLTLVGQGAAILTAIGAGFYAAKRVNRTDSVQSAAADVEIAQAKVEAAIPAGQFAEIRRLQQSVREMESKIIVLSHRVSDLEIALDGIEAYMQLIILCEECRVKNEKMITRITELLKRREQHAAHKPAGFPTAEEIAATFAGKENYERGMTQ